MEIPLSYDFTLSDGSLFSFVFRLRAPRITNYNDKIQLKISNSSLRTSCELIQFCKDGNIVESQMGSTDFIRRKLCLFCAYKTSLAERYRNEQMDINILSRNCSHAIKRCTPSVKEVGDLIQCIRRYFS